MSIYTAPPSQPFLVTVGTNLDQTLPWTAVQVIVDNYTNQWLYIPGAKRYVPPGNVGAVLPISAITAGQASWSTPPGITPNTIIAGQQATVVFLSAGIDAPPSSGVLTANQMGDTLAQKLSQMELWQNGPLASGETTTIQIGAGTDSPYPANAASWQILILGLNGAGYGCRLFWEGVDPDGTVLYECQRDTSTKIYGTVLASGPIDAEGLEFQITLPSGAPAGCTWRLYTSAETVQDNWYDTAIYGPRVSNAISTIGYDGALLWYSGWTITSGGNQAFPIPTYRGPISLGIQSSQAGHAALAEYDYTGSLLSAVNNIPISSSGQGDQSTVEFLPATGNQIILFNDDLSASNTFYFELRAIKDRA